MQGDQNLTFDVVKGSVCTVKREGQFVGLREKKLLISEVSSNFDDFLKPKPPIL